MGTTDSFDVVVLGSGMGGMCSAARLAHAGFKTLLVERLAFIGGRSSSLDYKGYTKTTGAIIISANSVIEDTFRDVGAEFNVRSVGARWRVDGQDHDWQISEGLGRAMMAVTKDPDGTGRLLGAIMNAVTWQPPTGTMSLRRWVAQYTTDERVLQTFHPLVTALLCSTVDEVPVADVFAFIRNQFERPWDIALGPKGNIELFRPLLDTVKKNGGQIRRNAEVKRILICDNKVTGVILKTRSGEQQVNAKAIVSNLGPVATVELAGREHFDAAYLEALELVQPVPLYITLNITSDEPLLDHPALVFPVDARKISAFMDPTVSSPEMAPPGKHMLHVWGAMTQPIHGEINREHEIQATMDELKRLVPAVADKGTILSIECFDRDWPTFRCVSSELPHRSSVAELYNVGDGIRKPGYVGVALGAETARIVTQDIVSRVQPG
ncbi:MAG TPA: FAD-dependent oxidoreductase [Steroidobacteraceae bacterium]|nr:FAD-dependent oxidoreductase [Steroidobacteraceae bacterium]